MLHHACNGRWANENDGFGLGARKNKIKLNDTMRDFFCNFFNNFDLISSFQREKVIKSEPLKKLQ